MKEGNTTLSVPKEFAEHLREDVEGGNDYERIHNWAEENFCSKDKVNNEDLLEAINNKEGYNNSITEKELEEKLEGIETITKKDIDDVMQKYI